MKKTKKQITIITVACIIIAIILGLGIAAPIAYTNGDLWFAHPQKKAADGQIRVACVGDSITYGAGIKGWTENNYPTALNKLLGDGYCVNNFGYSGRTAMYDGDNPYTEDRLFDQSIDFQPNIVILMLGTNDSKPYNWKGAAAYKADFKRLIENYTALSSVSRVFLITPPPAFSYKGEVMFDINADIISDEIRTAVTELANEMHVGLIDIYAVFSDKPELYSDGIHPNAEGAKLFAETVYAALR